MSAIPPRRPVVLALHGFTLSGAMFDELADLVEADFIAPDLPGHGAGSPAPNTWHETVVEVLALIDRHRPDVVLGYSMGGRICIAAALQSELPFTAVMVSAGPGIENEAERAARRRADESLARRLEAMRPEEFASEWESNEQLGGHETLAAIRRSNTTRGMAAALRSAGQGAQPYLGAELGRMSRPTIWIAGAKDPKYVAIAKEAADRSPDAKVEIVAGARHNVVADAPDSIAAALAEAIASRRIV